MTYTPLELAAAFMATGELDDALAALDPHLAAHPDDAEARRMRAEVHARRPGEASLRAALVDYRALPALTSDDALRLSLLDERLGAPDDALSTIAQARAADPVHPRLIERQIGLLRALGRPAEALAVIESLDEAERGNWRWQSWAGDLAMQMGDFARARRAYALALDGLERAGEAMDARWAGPERARLLLARAESARHLGDAASAEADLNAAAALIPDDPAIGFGRGLLAMLRGDEMAARALIEAALAAAPDVMRAAFIAELRADARFASLMPGVTKVNSAPES